MKKNKICVIGLGYVGLPLAVHLSKHFDLIGFDKNKERVLSLKQNIDETINALAMTSPFSLEEKQILLETKNLSLRKTKIAEILSTYSHDNFNNTTLQ